MKVLVTGHRGFIGRYVFADWRRGYGFDVHGIDTPDDVGDFPHELLPLRHVSEDLFKEQVRKKNLNSKHDLPNLTEVERDALFATVKYYGAKPAYKQAVFGVAITAPTTGGSHPSVDPNPFSKPTTGTTGGTGGILGKLDNAVTTAVYNSGLVPSQVTNPSTFVSQQQYNAGYNAKSQYNAKYLNNVPMMKSQDFWPLPCHTRFYDNFSSF